MYNAVCPQGLSILKIEATQKVSFIENAALELQRCARIRKLLISGINGLNSRILSSLTDSLMMQTSHIWSLNQQIIPSKHTSHLPTQQHLPNISTSSVQPLTCPLYPN